MDATISPDLKQLKTQLFVARRKLVETGTRNRLIHVNRKSGRANAVNIVNERSDDVFRILVDERKRMKFWATGTDRTPADGSTRDGEESDIVLPDPPRSQVRDPADERYTDDRLETLLGPNGQQKRLLKLYRDARTAEEEQGINILYLALGFLTWFEDDNSSVEREAPLILLPVELVRNERTSAHDLRLRDDDIVTNLPLQEKLKAEFGIHLPEIGVSDDGVWTPGGYFDQIDDVIAAKPRWSVDRDGMQLGFFSFAKLLMLRDLDPDNWPTGRLLHSGLLSGLLNSTFEPDSPVFDDKSDNLDEKLDPAELFHVLDADRSQTIVIEEVRKGRNLVVQGPPGTGKSQTIANIIAAAVHDGKRVLFVAEKMAALSVVHDRLKNCGLEHVALELHSRAANKRAVLHELARTLNEGMAVASVRDDAEAVRLPRDKLNAIVRVLHKPVGGCAMTPYQAMAVMSAMKGKGVPVPEVDGQPLATMPDDAVEALCKDIDAFGHLLETDRSHAENPFRGAGHLDLQPLDLERLALKTRDAAALARSLAEKAGRFRSALGMTSDTIATADQTAAALACAEGAPAAAGAMIPVLFAQAGNAAFVASLDHALAWVNAAGDNPFVDSALSVPAGEMRAALGAGAGSFLARFGARYRSASRLLASLLKTDLPKRAADRLALADKLIALQRLDERYREARAVLEPRLGNLWAGEATDFAGASDSAAFVRHFLTIAPSAPEQTVGVLVANRAKIGPVARELSALTKGLRSALEAVFASLALDPALAFDGVDPREIELAALANRLDGMADEQHRYDLWTRHCALRDSIEAHGLAGLAVRMQNGALDGQGAVDEVRHARAEAAWAMSRQAQPALAALGNVARHDLVKQFMAAEHERMKSVRKLVAAAHLTRVPTGAIGEMGFVRSQIARQRSHAPIRKLIEKAGPVIQRIRPVFLMSPISVAQFLPPESVEFDLLVIDEASQVKPEDAFGAIARAGQIVVVGDQKQLPPTSFFDKMTNNADSDDEDDEPPLAGYATEAESILSLCEARKLPDRMLSWHYRSRDPSLIKVSNVEFYDHKLVLPPSPLEKDPSFGLRFIKVDGIYTPKGSAEGTPGTNLIEAERLVEAVKAHARQTPALSLGIATFNMTQRNCVSEVLERERRSDDVLDDFLREGRVEDVFIKNIENVQGDERDVIMISVGFGPRLPGQRLPSMNFGPVNKEGGGRRLNVLFSRARVRCDVFCSFEPGDIAVDGKSDGVRIFKRYLEFAKSGIIDEATATGDGPDSPFEGDVAAFVRDLGYSVDHQVGSGGFRIDLGVLHPERPGQYMLAIECDGATYHSSLWSRERDRLRQEVLEHLGWRFHRIWSTDWFLRRDNEKERLRRALEAAAPDGNAASAIKGANIGIRPVAATEATRNTSPVAPVRLETPRTLSTPYKRAAVRGDTRIEPHDADPKLANRLVSEIVMQEGPIHQDEVARRFAAAFGKERTGGRIVETANRALTRMSGRPLDPNSPGSTLVCDDGFWMTEDQRAEPPVRNRKAEAGTSLVKADMLPPVELMQAARLIMRECGTVGLDDLVTTIVRELGFARTGSDLKAVIEDAARNVLGE